MWRMVQRRKEPYDLVATVMDQNYVGTSKEDPRLRAAVDRTAGMVLLYQMRLFRCYYHSTCGGHTEAVQDVFPDPALLPLSPVPCPYCRGSKHYRWHSAIAKAELAEALRKAGLSARQVVSLQVTSRSRSGRALEVAIGTGEAGGTRMPANDFRLAVGPSRLPSTLFEVRDIGNRLEFQGRGFGHGVGMCQWGARGMAEAHHSAPEILAHYYPGAELHRLYEGRGTI
jgi:stage II sporulation protein D